MHRSQSVQPVVFVCLTVTVTYIHSQWKDRVGGGEGGAQFVNFVSS